MNTDVSKSAAELAETGADRQAWTAPMLRRIRAGEAENAFTQTVEDGVFTDS